MAAAVLGAWNCSLYAIERRARAASGLTVKVHKRKRPTYIEIGRRGDFATISVPMMPPRRHGCRRRKAGRGVAWGAGWPGARRCPLRLPGRTVRSPSPASRG